MSISSNLPKKHPTTKYDSVPSCSRSLDLLASHVVYRRNPSRLVRVVRKGSSRSHVQWGFPVDPARSQPARSKTQKQNCQGSGGLWQVRVGIFQLTLTALLGSLESLVMIFAYFRHLCAQSMWILRIRNLQIHWLNSDTKASWLSITHFWSHSFRHP